MKKILLKIATPIFIIAIASVSRLVPHVPNFTPVGSIALFGGVYLPKKYSFFIPLIVMFVTDIFLGFHSTMIYVYGSFVLASIIGIWLRKRKNIKNIIGASMTSSILFFLITNFGVWAQGAYSRGIDGLIQSYIMGLPFFQWTLLGDLFYTGVIFGGYEIALKFADNKNTAISTL